ncbi:MAG TPA: elongation factor G [Steroidobacteraceae bacterium]|jgi:elongation factor G|nr:elongation factor G [Steroidobacteraceae bacterium]
MGHTTQGIRNIALVGAAGAGKTLLAESLLLEAGAIRTKGSLARGSTVSDFDPQEKALQHSLDSSILTFDCDSTRIHLLDTPGYPDFLGRALSVLEAVEAVAVIVSATSGPDAITHRLMDFARDRGLSRLVVINKIDSRDAKSADVLLQMRETFGAECLPLNLPAQGGQSVVDCFFQPHGAAADFSTVETAHTQLIDQVIELDEQLMSVYLEQGEEISPEQLHDPFEQALREGHLVPVCFASAETGAGIAELLRAITRLLPNPTEGNPPPFLKGSGERAQRVEVMPDAGKHVIAHVFKITIDPYVGKLGVLRVHQGTVRPGAQLFVGDARKPFKIAHLYKLLGKDAAEIPAAIPGDICAIAKVEELHLDAVLHDSHDEDQYHLKPVAFPPPMLGLAIEPERRGDEQRLADTLHKLTAEDPCIRIEHHAAVNETVLYGTGELHLRAVLDRMSRRYGVRVKTHPPSIPYRETVTRPAEGHCRHKKQTGGAGQFGEVFLRIEALQRGAGFEFVDEVVGGAIPGQFIPAVEKGVRQVLTEGALAGFPLQDIRVTVLDGKHHAVDSKEVAFVSAGRKAFLDAIHKASPIVLEPIVHLEITAPASAIGDITGDLATKRARINGNSTLPGQLTTVSALVPLAEISDYQTRLKALTGGQGTYAMELSHYDPVPPRRQQELVQAYRPRAEEE